MFTDWLHLNYLCFYGSTAYISDIFKYILFFSIFEWLVKKIITEMHGWLHLLLAIGSVSKKWWGSRRESPPSSFNQGQSWRRSIPRSQVTCIRPYYKTEKLKKKLKMTRDKRCLAEDRENVAHMKPFGETDVLEQWFV